MLKIVKKIIRFSGIWLIYSICKCKTKKNQLRWKTIFLYSRNNQNVQSGIDA